MSPGVPSWVEETASFPRVSGDEPANFAELKDGLEFSPRERG